MMPLVHDWVCVAAEQRPRGGLYYLIERVLDPHPYLCCVCRDPHCSACEPRTELLCHATGSTREVMPERLPIESICSTQSCFPGVTVRQLHVFDGEWRREETGLVQCAVTHLFLCNCTQ